MKLLRAVLWLVGLAIVAVIGWVGVQVWLAPRDWRETDAGDLLDDVWLEFTELAEVVPGTGGGDDADDERVSDDDDDGGHDDDGNDDDDDDAPGAVTVVGGVARLVMDTETQALGGVETAPAAALSLVPETTALATVIDPLPLITARDDYVAAAYEAEIIERQVDALAREHQRLQALYQDDANIALKTVQQAEAAWRTAQARLRQAWAALHARHGRIEVAWGPVLADWALDDDNPAFRRLARREEALIRVTLPPGRSLEPEPGPVRIAAGGARAEARPALYVSPALDTDPRLPGETHLYRTAAHGLRVGMRLDVWLTAPGPALDGVEVPLAAVVWSIDRAWAYVQVADDQFERRPVTTDHPTAGGWLVTDHIAVGEPLVVAGAQMLFAEEFRWQIRDEDDD